MTTTKSTSNGAEFKNGMPSLEKDNKVNDFAKWFQMGRLTAAQNKIAEELAQKEQMVMQEQLEAQKMQQEAYQIMSMVNTIQATQNQELEEMGGLMKGASEQLANMQSAMPPQQGMM